jgi:hypothetical protein
MPIVRLSLPAIAAGLALAVSGCGGGGGDEGKNEKNFSGDKKPVAAAIDQLVDASHAGDANKICTQVFTPGLATAIASRAKSTCVAVVQKQIVSPQEDITVTDIRIQGSNALATVREQNKNVTRLSLVQQDDGWRINAIQ